MSSRPTDSCRDRLAAFFHFSHRSALDQACAVYAAASKEIDLKRIRSWSQREGKLEAFKEFATEAMAGMFHPLRTLLLAFAGGVSRHQAEVIEYLVEENRVLKDRCRVVRSG